jgi:hypothetical protein
MRHFGDHVVGVVVAVGAGEDEDAEFHGAGMIVNEAVRETRGWIEAVGEGQAGRGI